MCVCSVPAMAGVHPSLGYYLPACNLESCYSIGTASPQKNENQKKLSTTTKYLVTYEHKSNKAAYSSFSLTFVDCSLLLFSQEPTQVLSLERGLKVT